MNLLLIKTSSMGDLIHTFPALSDAHQALPDLKIDWVVEDVFIDIPSWHPVVHNIIPVALRTWRKNFLTRETRSGLQMFRKELKRKHYDLILDAQGLAKSAVLTFLAKGKRAGLDFRSARESIASFAYQKKCKVHFYQHAVVRMRQLFAKALDYELPQTSPNFALDQAIFKKDIHSLPYLVFLHGTTWLSKQWPETYWMQLAKLAEAAGFQIKISGGNEEEVARAFRLSASSQAIEVLPFLSISKMTALLANAKGVVAIDTGFGHLASALSVPTVSIYGSTNAAYTGALGQNVAHLSANFSCSPCYRRDCKYKDTNSVKPACYQTVPPKQVWAALKRLMSLSNNLHI